MSMCAGREICTVMVEKKNRFVGIFEAVAGPESEHLLHNNHVNPIPSSPTRTVHKNPLHRIEKLHKRPPLMVRWLSLI